MAAAAGLKPRAVGAAPHTAAAHAPPSPTTVPKVPPAPACERSAGADPSVPGLADIDWQAPWLAHWRALGQPLAQRIAAGAPLLEALNAGSPAPVRFVPHSALPAGVAYEAFVRDTAQVPTREGLHDFFNALCWMHFPQAKRQLNALQAAEIARHGVQARRGPVRDAITVFDENALLIQAPDEVWQALTAHRWQEALVAQRARWAGVRLWTFGHAALEKLVRPYPGITVHLWRVPQRVGAELDVAELDAWLAQDLQPAKLATKPFSPLPILGVPGWWAANAEPAFYADRTVFRPARAARRHPGAADGV